jgi:hypothetical protein
MNSNAYFSERVVINRHDLLWGPSLKFGVERRMLERQGDELAKTTSFLRYKPGSKFQVHDLGIEISLSDVTFSD